MQVKELAAADDESDQEADQPAAASPPDEAEPVAQTAVPETVQQVDVAAKEAAQLQQQDAGMESTGMISE